MLWIRFQVVLFAFSGILLATAATRVVAATNNAALAYWQAFAQLPSVDDDQLKRLKNAPTADLDDPTRDLVTKSRAAVVSMRRAASMPRCDWGLEYDAGPHMVMPHLSKARQLARYACLHARQQFADGRVDAALETMRDTLIMARHVGTDQVIIAALVQYAIEQLSIETTCRELLQLSDSQLNTLVGYVDALPAGSSMKLALKLESDVYVGWARRVVQKAETDQMALEALLSIVAESGDDDVAQPAAVTRSEIVGWLDQTETDYEELQAVVDLPDEQFQPRWERLLSRTRVGNPYSAIVLPGVKSLRVARDRNSAMWSLFRVAIAIRQDGKTALGPASRSLGLEGVGLSEWADGFRLTTQVKGSGEPVVLSVGPSPPRSD